MPGGAKQGKASSTSLVTGANVSTIRSINGGLDVADDLGIPSRYVLEAPSLRRRPTGLILRAGRKTALCALMEPVGVAWPGFDEAHGVDWAPDVGP
jgi:hypothetical protein